ncbi:MAG: tagatose 1,6-diphosphate aldolase, partial [Methylocella sp.]
ASAILLDPEYGLTAARMRAKNAGLLLAYENSGYDNTQPGRLPDLLDHWSVRRLVEAGADCIKILLYYTPFDPPKINETKHAWVERIGGECAAADVPFFLEFVGYDPKGGDEKRLAYAKQKPDIVIKSMEEFAKDKYKVDVLKVEIPIDVKFLKGSKAFNGKEAAYDLEEAKKIFRRQDASVKKPFIYLSAGVDDDIFRESLELAIGAGVNFAGVLCGRATWKDGIPVYGKEGAKALEAWLLDRGVRNIKALNTTLAKGARAWHDKYGGRDQVKALARVK